MIDALLVLTGPETLTPYQRLDRREKIAWFEQWLLRERQEEFPATEQLVDGLYLRTIVIPEGSVLTGEIHLRGHVSVVDGDITIATEDDTKRLTGHHILISKPGMKRVGWAHAKTTWTTIHATALTEIARIPETLTTRIYPEIDAGPLPFDRRPGSMEVVCHSS